MCDPNDWTEEDEIAAREEHEYTQRMDAEEAAHLEACREFDRMKWEQENLVDSFYTLGLSERDFYCE